LIIKKTLFDEIGGFDGRFFLYYEDADLCKRIRNKGYKIYYLPGINIIHFKGENTNKIFLDYTYYYSKKSQILYYKIHHDISQVISIRIYLFIKFGILAIMTWRRIYFKLLGLIVTPVEC
jgi:GT2 family glycosyltransferase